MLCDGRCDDCTGEATETVDTSDGWLKLEHLCEPCLAAWKKRVEDGPGDDVLLDGEVFRGNEAAAFQAEQAWAAWRLK
jgi:hypothetical protein